LKFIELKLDHNDNVFVITCCYRVLSMPLVCAPPVDPVVAVPGPVVAVSGPVVVEAGPVAVEAGPVAVDLPALGVPVVYQLVLDELGLVLGEQGLVLELVDDLDLLVLWVAIK
jgi:hypothetical protein